MATTLLTAHDAEAFVQAWIRNAEALVKASYFDPMGTTPWRKVLVRPVELKAGLRWQVSRFDAKKDFTQNHEAGALVPVLAELWAMGFRSVVLELADRKISLARTGRGDFKVSEVAASHPQGPGRTLAHDRSKETLVSGDAPYLAPLGFLTADGKIRVERRDKLAQITEFLKLVEDLNVFPKADEPFSVVDFGCGNAYLTFALYHRLANERQIKANVTGVDLKEDLILNHRRRVSDLGWSGLNFEPGTIQAYQAHGRPDMVVALHACDTATDDALAQGLAWGARCLIVAPCCQHHLQVQLDRAKPNPSVAALFRHGLTGERQGDLLTDVFRAQLLRLHGYKTDVVQFVDAGHTPKNLMIRAVKTDTPAPAHFWTEYQAMKEFWQVTPYLEEKIGLPKR